MRGPRLAATAMAAAALPLVSYFLTLDEAVRPIAVAVGWVTTLLIALGLARGVAMPALEIGAMAAAIGIAWFASTGTSYAMFVPSIAIQGLLFWLFARTLLPGREPLVVSIARILRGDLAPELARYARNVTRAWCVFFASVALLLACAAVFASVAVWSLLANVVAYVLVALMFAAEYAYRRKRFPNYEHVSPLRMIRRLAAAGYFQR
jgi:uncharacterized membrane protein